MIRKLSMISSPAGSGDLFYAAGRSNEASVCGEFRSVLAEHSGMKHVFPVASGAAALYLILEAVKRGSRRTEVLLPAYTAGCLVTVVRKAGLKVRLYDISLKDFGPDVDSILRAVSGDTLAVVYVHLFGIGTARLGDLRNRLGPDIAIIEDCAQAMGSQAGGRRAGSGPEVSFLSFNRGKNLPLFSGGAIMTKSDSLAEEIEREYVKLKGPFQAADALRAFIGLSCLGLSSMPLVYGLLYPAAARFKDNRPPDDIIVGRMANFQMALGLRLIEKSDALFGKRMKNGMRLIGKLKGSPALSLPEIPEGSAPVFNRLPVLFRSPDGPARAERALFAAGIESSRMYGKTLYQMFDLGVSGDLFPGASACAARLLTLPVHPSVTDRDIDTMSDILRSV